MARAGGEPRLLAPLLFAILVAATLLAFVLVERERDQPRLIDNVTVTQSFDPEAGPGERSARLRFRITRESAADVVVVDQSGTVVATVIEDRALDDFDFHDFRWHGELDEGGLAAPGAYRFRLELDGIGRTITIPEPTQVVATAEATSAESS